jgi:hypothetical protein
MTRRVLSTWHYATDTAPSGALFYWSYIYYLSKFYELLDTVLLVLKGRVMGGMRAVSKNSLGTLELAVGCKGSVIHRLLYV